jgi:pimeloyl-ACP methyl ester carboxylesterase
VTVAVGSASSPLYREVAAALRETIPDARVVTIPGADHMAPVSRPESILPVIEAALDELAAHATSTRTGPTTAADPAR